MPLRVALGVFAALRAVLVYGEATRLASEPLEVPRIRPAAPVAHPGVVGWAPVNRG